MSIPGWWPIVVWAVFLPLIPLWAYILFKISAKWEASALNWFNRYLPKDKHTWQWVSQDAQRLGVWSDDPLGIFWLHYVFEIEKRKSNEPGTSPSPVLVILSLTAFCSLALLIISIMFWFVFGMNLPVMLTGTFLIYLSWYLAGMILLVAWWQAKWVRRYNCVIIMSQGKSYAVHIRWTFWDLITFGRPNYIIYEIRPERITQPLTSTDPEDVARARDIETNPLVERVINWILTSRGIMAVQLEALAAQYGKVIFPRDVSGFVEAINAAAKRNNELQKFTDGTMGDAGAQYRSVREEDGSIMEAKSQYNHVMELIPEFSGRQIKLNIFDLMQDDFVMPVKPETRFRGSLTNNN